MNPKFGKRLSALLLSAVVAAGSMTSAGACTGMYIGSEESANGSTFVGRAEDLRKLYDKVFEVIPAADHEDSSVYKDTSGFSMPYSAHTYRYTVMRDSVNAGETMTDNGNITEIAYGEVGMNEKGVAVSATVSTYNNDDAKTADPFNKSGGLYEISLNSVILMQADSARDGVEKLAKIIDDHGAGECNSLTISDANEIWDFEIVSGHQYVAVKMPKDKVSVNPNMLIMNEVDISDTDNILASDGLISMPQENGFLVSSQVQAPTEDDVDSAEDKKEITKIDIQKTYGSRDFGDSQYSRYWQGVNYLNKELANSVSIDRVETGIAPAGPFNMLFNADHKIDTYEALRLLAYRGEGTKYDSNTTNKYAICNENQAESHVFEIRDNMPDALSIVQWQSMSRAEFSLYLPFYSNLITDTSDIFKSEYFVDTIGWYTVPDIEEVLADENFPAETSAYWVFAAINALCDKDRERYGANVKKFWENYQKQLIAQQADVDTAMKQIYAYSPALAEQKATELGKAVSEEAFDYAKSILTELRAFIAAHSNDDAVFIPTVLTENKLPTYSINMDGVNGTGIPSSNHHHSSGSSSSSNNSTAKPSEPEQPAQPSQPSQSDKSFSDVKSGDWYNDAVQYVTDKGLMSGTGDNKFSPNASTTRGMLMTVLARYAGKDTSGSTPWYQAGMDWAKANGVSDGTKPTVNITREQLVTMLYRYAGSPKSDGSLSDFSDSASVSSYAVNAMQWAVANGIVNGSNGKLNPKNNATRAEVAAILMRFCEMSK